MAGRSIFSRQTAWALGVALWVAGGLMLWDDRLREIRGGSRGRRRR